VTSLVQSNPICLIQTVSLAHVTKNNTTSFRFLLRKMPGVRLLMQLNISTCSPDVGRGNTRLFDPGKIGICASKCQISPWIVYRGSLWYFCLNPMCVWFFQQFRCLLVKCI